MRYEHCVSMSDDLKLLQLDVETLFGMSPSKRIERQNDPDGSPAPRLFFAGCTQGNIVRVRHDIDDEVAERLHAITANEPPWRDPWALPECIGKLLDVLSNAPPFVTGPASRIPLSVGTGVIYQLPHHVKYEHPAIIVRGDTVEGGEMIARLAKRGFPPTFSEAGFKEVSDFWEPWCLAIEGEDVAAIAFAARLGDQAAEIGVYTFPNFRARGFAAAVTAGWSSLPILDGRALFYSTSRSNRSSQRVAARLGLRLIGASVNIS
jgi:hypothetical protein